MLNLSSASLRHRPRWRGDVEWILRRAGLPAPGQECYAPVLSLRLSPHVTAPSPSRAGRQGVGGREGPKVWMTDGVHAEVVAPGAGGGLRPGCRLAWTSWETESSSPGSQLKSGGSGRSVERGSSGVRQRVSTIGLPDNSDEAGGLQSSTSLQPSPSPIQWQQQAPLWNATSNSLFGSRQPGSRSSSKNECVRAGRASILSKGLYTSSLLICT